MLCRLPTLAKVGLLLLCSVLPPARAGAQSLTLFPEQHWARGAFHRLAAVGEISTAAAALSWPVNRAQALRWLDGAAQESARIRLLRTLLEREESAHWLHARAAVGAETVRGALRAGTMELVNDAYVYPGAVRLPESSAALLRAEIAAAIGDRLALAAQGTVLGSEAALDAIYLNARVGDALIWAGRRNWSAGNVSAANLVLNNAVMNGAGLSTRSGLRVPVLGTIYPDFLLARMERSGSVEHPWFHAARITMTPAPALAIGLNRAVIFGGEGDESISPARVLLMLAGFSDIAGKDSDFENQVASIDIFWTTRVGQAPLALYGELGADDSGWAFLHVPGVIAGLEIAELPALPELSLGLEAVHITRRCCSYPPWYQHGALADGWTDRGRLLGHPLGGAGNEVTLLWRADLPAVPLMAAGRVYVRERAAENLLAPPHQGRSTGARLEAWWPWRRTQLQLLADFEFGERGWQRSAFSAVGQVFF